MFEAFASFVGDAAAYATGRILGQTFKLEPKKAQTLGEVLVLGVVVVIAVAITVTYS